MASMEFLTMEARSYGSGLGCDGVVAAAAAVAGGEPLSPSTTSPVSVSAHAGLRLMAPRLAIAPQQNELNMFLTVDNLDGDGVTNDVNVLQRSELDCLWGAEQLADINAESMQQLAHSSSSSKESPAATVIRTPELEEFEGKETLPGSRKRRNSLHREHSRKYRNNINLKLTELQDLLNKLQGDKVNGKNLSKSDILQHSMDVLKDYKERVAELNMDVATSSKKNMLKWIDQTVSGASSLYDVLCALMTLICSKRRWKYAEVWMPVQAEPAVLRMKGTYISSSGHDWTGCIENFRKMSESVVFESGSGLIGRVYKKQRAETIDNPSESRRFVRSESALRSGVNAVFGVPVVVQGRCEAVVAFYDTDHRTDDIESINLANNLVTYISNAYGAKKNSLRSNTKAHG